MESSDSVGVSFFFFQGIELSTPYYNVCLRQILTPMTLLTTKIVIIQTTGTFLTPRSVLCKRRRINVYEGNQILHQILLWTRILCLKLFLYFLLNCQICIFKQRVFTLHSILLQNEILQSLHCVQNKHVHLRNILLNMSTHRLKLFYFYNQPKIN